ncbi:MAG TPA: hypothetical protein VI461_13010 [Chitinophagaceae bacterium]|nr:hypothetical protein [Chitinophagaceae bacterium]
MLDKIFGRGKKKEEGPEPDISFGRYSDNNKPVGKVNRWTDADNLFKQKKYPESFDAFFEYLRDDPAQNVVYERNGAEGRFHFYQGSKIVRGRFNNDQLNAEVTLAKMPQPSVPVMRRLLEMNFTLYYSRFALDNDRLCMRFDSDIEGATPSKLYYGLKELSTKGDKQDDLLVQDFAVLEKADSEHITEIPLKEKEVKYEFLQKWIKQTLDTITSVDAEKFSGGISYMLLSLIYRIDYLLTPEGKMLNEMERTAAIYFKKDERPATEKNRDMIEEFKKIQAKPKEEVFSYLFRSKYTFAIVAPQNHKAITDSIHAANQNMPWYRDNSYPFIANQVTEYGISYCQYSYSLPRIITDLFYLYMRVNYGDYFQALGFREVYYDPVKNTFNSEKITEQIRKIQEKWKGKYPNADFKTQNLRYDNLVNFNQTFTAELEFLNMEA